MRLTRQVQYAVGEAPTGPHGGGGWTTSPPLSVLPKVADSSAGLGRCCFGLSLRSPPWSASLPTRGSLPFMRPGCSPVGLPLAAPTVRSLSVRSLGVCRSVKYYIARSTRLAAYPSGVFCTPWFVYLSRVLRATGHCCDRNHRIIPDFYRLASLPAVHFRS